MARVLPVAPGQTPTLTDWLYGADPGCDPPGVEVTSPALHEPVPADSAHRGPSSLNAARVPVPPCSRQTAGDRADSPRDG